MSKRGYIYRYLLIVKKLQASKYASFEELKSYLDSNFDFMQMQDDTLTVGLSLRTLQRDIKEIRNTFNVNIEYSRSEKGYFIDNMEVDNVNFQRRIEAFDMFNSLNIAKDITPFVHLEKRRPEGTDNLYLLLQAIKKKVVVKFSYEKFWKEEITTREFEPYGLKEFKYRWYVLGKDTKDNVVKTFGLDRISDLEITNKKFKLPKEYNIEEQFRYSFGIISPNAEEPEVIILSFDPVQGKYIKTLALHYDQEEIVSNSKEFRIKLKLYITHDLVMELLSYGKNLKVIAPAKLVKRIKDEHKKAFEQYK